MPLDKKEILVRTLLRNTAEWPCRFPNLGDCWIYLKDDGSLSTNRPTAKGEHIARLVLKHYGFITKDKPNALHKCDDECCIRPSHLYAGTASDNGKDIRRKIVDRQHKDYSNVHR
jgi:hypothetical protein